MMELGPFRVEKDGKTLHRNEYAWNKESPAGVGFSYSNRTSDYKSSGDLRTAQDSLPFLFTGSKDFLNTKPGNFSWQERVMQAIMYPSGDTDGALPLLCSKYAINKLGMRIKTAWYPWYIHGEVGGYAVGYQNLTFVTVRGAGHSVPSYQKAWALVLFSSFLNGKLPPSARRLIESRKSPHPESWALLNDQEDSHNSPVYVGSQKGMMQSDKINALPGQPEGVDFDQYAGYVMVDPIADRALFYYFVESPQNSSDKPLVLWLNGGPGCSSLGYGAMLELGPFRVNKDGKTLYRNEYAWNKVANVIFLESPAGVGFSYSNDSSDYTKVGDKRTTKDSYVFLINWLERFPQYKRRDFFITGESYAGHYVPQLAYYILSRNKNTNQTVINLKGIAIGNAWIDDAICMKGMFDYLWTHALNSDETNEGINKYCNFVSEDSVSKKGDGDDNTIQCGKYLSQGFREMGFIDLYDIYAPQCNLSAIKPGSNGNIMNFDPCSGFHVKSYLNLAKVQAAFHAKATKWSGCSSVGWTDSPMSVLPEIRNLSREIRVWIYSGDTDGRVPVTSSRYAIKTLELPVETAWRPWYSNSEVGGYVVGYKGVVFTTVRGAGHTVPSYQPERALTMITSFLHGKLPPDVSPF
ncbi:hypothetical protein Gorai_016444 [Gossypium raimondii]|uniref:Carboxypeptidase n=1 Tax=Gossypium raimondii TaxID=29730 RepID=A0A7J8P8T3_GOSRA|nr:hypothetical protein [Gossypium raimondii]